MASLIDRIKGSMTGLNPFTPAKPRDKSRTTVLTNRFDEQVWQKVRTTEQIDALIYDLSIGDEHNGGTRKPFDGAPECVHDLFFTFYKAAAHLLEKNEVVKESYPVRGLIKEIMDNPRLDELQPLTAGDATLSTIAVQAMSEVVKEIVSRVPQPPEPPPPGGEGDGPGQGDGEGDGEGDGGGEGAGEGGEGGGDGESNPGASAEDVAWQELIDELLDEIDVERLANKAMQEAADDVEELDSVRRGFDLDDGEWRSMSPEKRLDMIERFRHPRMKMLADAVGRMKRFALGVRATRITNVPHEIYDVELGQDIRRVLKSEFAFLSDPGASYEFYRRYASRELMQYKMRGTEDVGKGPIQVCIDKSGSMNGAPFDWAMAVAESLRRFAADESRDYHAMFFGNNNDRHSFDFPGGKAEFEKVLAFLSCEANGGTEFDGVLTEALQRASSAFDSESKGKADIVFITDGEAHLSDEWIEAFNSERQRVGVRVFSIYIGGARDMYYSRGPLGLLSRISDAVIPVSDLRPESVQQVFASV